MMSASPASLNVFAGTSVTTTINIVRGAYKGVVTLGTLPLQPGVAADFNPASLSGSTLSSTLTVTAAADATTNLGGIVVRATGPDSLQQFLEIPLQVSRPQVRMVLAGTGTGTVTSSPAGVNCGNTCNGVFAYGTNVTLTATPAAGSVFAGWFGGGCTGTAPTCSLVVTAAPQITATFNSSAQTFSLGVSPTTASVAQGGSATATAKIVRSNGFAGAVTLTPSGAPTGLTVTVNPSTTTDTAATLNIAAALSVPAGTYPVIITGTASGLPSQTATLGVQVTPASGGSGDIAFSYAGCDPSEVPIWVAAQNGTGAWSRVMPGPNNTFAFNISAVGGVAFVTTDGAGYYTGVLYGNRADFTSLALGDRCRGLEPSAGTARLTGSVSATGAATTAAVALGRAHTEFPVVAGTTLSYALDGVPAGRRDLIGATVVKNSSGVTTGVSRLILRRNVTYTSAIPGLNFGGPEAVIPVNRPIGTLNLDGDASTAEVSFVTVNGSSAPYVSRQGGPNGVPFSGLPDSLLQPGDLHAIQIVAASASGTSFRVAILLHHSVVTDTVAFGPALNQPNVTTIGTSPYLRLRAQVASQTAYSAAASVDFSQNENSVSVTTLAGYSANGPSNWSLDTPDLSSAGYNPVWGLKSGAPVDWEVVALGGSVLPFLGATPSDGVRTLGAGVSSSASATSQRRRLSIVNKGAWSR
jgi:hypothetical protein